MKTDRQTSAPVQDLRLSAPPRAWLPWAAGAGLFAATLITEATVHIVVFDAPDFATALFAPDAHELWMRAVIAIFIFALTAGWALSIRNHTRHEAALREHRERLCGLATHLANGEHEQYRSIALRLHEDVAQELAAGQLFLRAGTSEDGVVDPEIVHTISRVLDRAVTNCREIAQELSPPVLDYGLMPALETLATQLTARSGASIDIAPAEDFTLAAPLLMASYHALAGVLAGAASNPDTRTVRVTAERTDHLVHVNVSWDAEEQEDPLDVRDALSVFGIGLERLVETGRTVVRLTAPLMLW